MSRRYKNSHKLGSNQDISNGENSMAQLYQSGNPPSQDRSEVSAASVHIDVNPRIGENNQPDEVGRAPGTELSVAGKPQPEEVGRGRMVRREITTNKRGARYAYNRRGRGGRIVDPLASAYSCLRNVFIIDVVIWFLLAAASAFGWYWGNTLGFSVTYIIPLLPGLIMEAICIIRGVNDYNFEFIDCTIKVRAIGNYIMIAIGLILLFIGLILWLVNGSIDWTFNTKDGFTNGVWASIFIVSGLSWLIFGLIAFVLLFFMQREWKKISGR